MASVKNTMLFCVRVTDGYFFPAPNSQFVGVDHVKNTLDRCRFICGNKDVEVYTLDDMALESEEMASVKDGRSYKDLPAAFAYRDAPHFKGCDFGRYHRHVNEARARSVTPYNMDDAIIPLPSPRPTPPAVAAHRPLRFIRALIRPRLQTAVSLTSVRSAPAHPTCGWLSPIMLRTKP